MNSPCIREASETCFHGCFPPPIVRLPASSAHDVVPKSTSTAATCENNFCAATTSTLNPDARFSNHESLISLRESFFNFIKAYPQYAQTEEADHVRAREYSHLSLSNHVCLDYIGHGLFSYAQQQSHYLNVSAASSSSCPPPPGGAGSAEVPFFEISCKSANLISQVMYGGQESELESKFRKRIMSFLNISEDDYSMVYTANQASAFKLLADSYPFQSNQNLLTVYDYESEAVSTMIDSSKKRGARALSAEFSWPNLRIQSDKLMKMIESKRKKKTQRGLFIFPLQSRITGGRYSYLWMSIAQENGWHVLLDACALGPKDMDTLGLSIFRPDFLICTFFKVFGENPSGFGCLFVKRSSASVLKNSTNSIGIASLNPATRKPEFIEESVTGDKETKEDDFAASSSGSTSAQNMNSEISDFHETEEDSGKNKGAHLSEIEELEISPVSFQFKNTESSANGSLEIEIRGLDHADSLGLILISSRTRYLINWLVNALLSLRHPHSENGLPLIKIYGPKIKFDRGPAVAFNVFDWKGEKVDPSLVQKLADRNNISLSYGFLQQIRFSDKYEEEKERMLKTRTEVKETVLNKKSAKLVSGISVVTASLGFLTNFEDIYRLWAFVARFLDADFVEKERWRYTALNQKTIEV